MKERSFKITDTYEAELLFEITVETDGSSFLVLYGQHINGGWCCIPNWGIGCEMGSPSDTFHNAKKLVQHGLSIAAADGIAAAIRVQYLSDKLHGTGHLY